MTYAGKFLVGANSAPRSTRLAIWMWVLLFAIAVPAFRQVNAQATGLTGTVTDPSGASIAGATVSFRNEATGATAQFATASDGLFTVAVTDTGPGIDPSDQAKIFEEFQQADGSSTKTKGGTGLGLSIAKRIVNLHGGRIWVSSAPGNGSTFFIDVPIKVEQQAGHA